MNVREAHLSDTAAVTRLLERAYPTLMASSYDASVLKAALPAMVRANPELMTSKCFYVVENDGEIIGCGGWSMQQPGSGKVEVGIAHLRHFATDPDMIRKGIGRSIIAKCAFDAAAKGVERFRAFAGLNAEPFYLSVGLIRLKLIEISIGMGVKIPIVLMEGRNSST